MIYGKDRPTVGGFDVQRQIADHPWVAIAGAFAAGYALGMSNPAPDRPAGYNRNNGLLDDVRQRFDDEIDIVKTAAVATLRNTLRETASMLRSGMPAGNTEPSHTDQPWRTAEEHYTPGRQDTPGRQASTAPNTSMGTGAGATGFDSPPRTTMPNSNPQAGESRQGTPYYPPGGPDRPISGDEPRR